MAVILQYVMTGRLTTNSGPNAYQTVYWSVWNEPDLTGAQSGYSGRLSNIQISSVSAVTPSSDFQGVIGPAGGDLSDNYPDPLVVGLDGYGLDGTFLNPIDGYGVVYNAITKKYTLAPSGFIAGGDLSGSSINQVVQSAASDLIDFTGGNIIFAESLINPIIQHGGVGANSILSIMGQNAIGSDEAGEIIIQGGSSVTGAVGNITISTGFNQAGDRPGLIYVIAGNAGVIGVQVQNGDSGLSLSSTGLEFFSLHGVPFQITDSSNVFFSVDTTVGVGTITIPPFAGNGDGYVAVDNSGNLSFAAGSPSGITFGGDLAGSTSSNQYVGSISGTAGAGGTLEIKTPILSWLSGLSPSNVTIDSFASSNPSGAGAAGQSITIQAQSGQNSSHSLSNGGTGGVINIFSGAGGTPGAGGAAGHSGTVNVGDGIANNLVIIPSSGTVGLSANSVLNLLVAGNTLAQGTSDGFLDFECGFRFDHTVVTGSSYAVDTGFPDYFVFINFAGAVAITLPPPTNGRQVSIKDISGLAATNVITVLPNSGELIDGQSSQLLNTNYAGKVFCSDGNNWFSTGSAFVSVSNINPGTSGQILLNSATPTPTWTTMSGDVAIGSSGSTTVKSLTGSAGVINIASTGNVITWAAATTSPGFAQTAPSSDVAPANLTITSQAPFASASTHQTAGNIVLELPNSIGGSTRPYVDVQYDGYSEWKFGALNGSGGLTGAVYFGGFSSPITPSTSNYVITATSSNTNIQSAGSTGTISLTQNNGALMVLGGSGLQLISGSVAIGSTAVVLSAAQYSLPFLKFSGTLSGNTTITFPATNGAKWTLDFTAVTFGSDTITLVANSANWSTVISSANSNTSDMFEITYSSAQGKLYGHTLTP